MEMFSNKSLKKLIIPLVIEQILAVAVGMADTIMVSSVGEAAVSGVSLVDMINVLIINVFAALATGGAVVAAQYLGADDRKRACRSANQLLLVTVVISAGIMGLCLLLQGPILRLFFGSIDQNVMDSALTYFWISALSYPFLAVYNSCAALYRSMGNSKVSMVVSVWMNVINIGGNALCVFVLNMGVAGVAVPSLVSRAVAAVAMLVLIHHPHNVISIRSYNGMKPDKAMIRRILRIGVPGGLENSLFQLGRVLVVSIISGFGTVQIAANAVANNLDAFGCIPGQAINLAVITVVGQCVGAGDWKQAEYYTKKLIKLTYLVTAVLNIGIILALPLLLKLYSVSPEALSLATVLVIIHNGCSILIWPPAFTLPNALRAANDVRFTMWTAIGSMWLFRIGASYVLGLWLQMGAVGVWIAMIMDWFFRAVLFTWRFFSGRWKQQKPLIRTAAKPEGDSV